MLDQSTRVAIRRLHEEGHGTRAIARALGISRGAVKKVLASYTFTALRQSGRRRNRLAGRSRRCPIGADPVI